MKFLLVNFLILISSSVFSDTGIHSIRLKQWDFDKGDPAINRLDALNRQYSYVELCSVDKGCVTTLWGHKKKVAIILERDTIFLKYDSNKIHLMDLGSYVSSGRDGDGRLFVTFKPTNLSVDVTMSGESGVKYLCDIDAGDLGQPTLGCQFYYQNKIQASIELKDSHDVFKLYAKGARPSGLRAKFTPDQVNTLLYKVKSSSGAWENKK